MDLKGLRAHLGDELWNRACEWAWAGAISKSWEREGYDRDDPENAPHELETLVWEAERMSWIERVRLAFDLYRSMPCYGNLMYIRTAYFGFSVEDRDAEQLFWEEYRSLVSDVDDRLADPVAYSLWVDYFEDPETMEASWRQIIDGDLSERGMERLLASAGPVPWALKAPLYQELMTDERWHPFIFRSLLGSAFDAYGKIDADEASALLERLVLPDDSQHLGELRRRLATLRLKRRLTRFRKRHERS